MQPLPDDILVFMAFRRGQEIKWTRRPLVVHKGEYVLTFCGKTVLARCGNLIAGRPCNPVKTCRQVFWKLLLRRRRNHRLQIIRLQATWQANQLKHPRKE